MTLTDAKAIAAHPAPHSLRDLREALDRLAVTAKNGGVRNSERATERLERRLEKLRTAIADREALLPPAPCHGDRARFCFACGLGMFPQDGS